MQQHLTVTVLFLSCLIKPYCYISAEKGVNEEELKKRLIVDGEMDVYAEVLALKAQVQTLTEQLATEKLKMEKLQKVSGTASTFIRWGKTKCLNDTDFVYEGFVAGKKYDDPGSGSDTQCLPSDPTWNKYNTQEDSYRAKIYGGELDAWSGTHIFNKDVLNEDMPCAVCRTSFPTTMMFPARSNCYPGWSLQYTGYLVTNSGGAGRGSYQSICLDMDPDFVPHSQADDNEHVVYLMDAQCGSLPCPPYIHGAELSCAVCSK